MCDPAVAKKIQDVHWSTNPLPQRAPRVRATGKAPLSVAPDAKVILLAQYKVPFGFSRMGKRNVTYLRIYVTSYLVSTPNAARCPRSGLLINVSLCPQTDSTVLLLMM